MGAGGGIQENGPLAAEEKKGKTERATVGRRTKGEKVESNDSTEVPDRRETSDIPASLPGCKIKEATGSH